ncbi:MAG: PAS domain S-box protein, partial [Candidatus Marinimicrobia bacterium]|nr:PAS domain S-box protein [Candidatus Neomarinimicrobiota bacterium]
MEANIKDINNAILHMGKYSHKEKLIGHSAIDFVVPEDRVMATENLSKELEIGRSIGAIEYALIASDGSVFNVESNASVLYDSSGNPEKLINVIRDITERKQAEETLKIVYNKLEEERNMFLTGPVIVFKWKPRGSDPVDYVSPNVRDILGYSAKDFLSGKVIYKEIVHEEDWDRVSQEVSKNSENGLDHFKHKPYRLIAKNGEILWVADYTTILRDEKGRIQNYLGYILDISESRQKQEQIQYSEEKYRTLTENLNVGIYRNTGLGGKMIEANPALVSMFGYENKEELRAAKVADLYQNPEDREQFNVKMLKDGFVRNEVLQLKQKDGTPFFGSVSAVAVKDKQGKVVYYDGIVEDITERKQSEEKQKESEQKHRTILESIEEGYFEVDLKGNLTFANRALCDMTGYTEDELIGLNNREYSDEVNAKKLFNTFNTIYRTGKPAELDNYEVINHISGIKVVLELTASLIFEDTSPIGFRGIVRDVTERQKMEQELRNSEELYRTLIETTPEAVTLTDLKGSIIYASQQTAQLHEYDDAYELIGKNSLDLIAQVDHQRAQEGLIKTLEKGIVRDLEYTLVKRDGSTFWGGLNAALVKDSNGNPSAFIATTMDISKRKIFEEDLKHKTQDLTLINELNDLNNKGASLIEIINHASDSIKKLYSGMGVAVYLIDDTGKNLELLNASTALGFLTKMESLLKTKLPAVRIPLTSDHKYVKILTENEIHIANDPDSIKAILNDFVNVLLIQKLRSKAKKMLSLIYKIFNINSIMTVPLRIDGNPIGVIDISSTRLFTIDDKKRMAQIAEQLTSIIQMKKTQEELMISENQFKSAFDHAVIGRALANASGKFIMVNKAFCNILKYSDEKLKAKRWQDITHPGDLEESGKYVSRLVSGEISSFSYIHRLLDKNGEVVWVDLNVVLMKDAAGHPQYFIGDIVNITDRVLAENKIKEFTQRTKAINEASHTLASSLDLQTVVDHCTQIAKQMFDADDVAIFIVDQDKEYLTPLANIGIYTEKVLALRLKMGEGLTGSVAQRGEARIVNRIDLTEIGKQVPGTPVEPESLMSVPLKIKDEVIGVITLSKLGEQEFADEDLSFIENLADISAVAIQNARLYEDVKQSEKLKTLFLANMSHEIRTPLTAIIGYTELIENSVRDKVRSEERQFFDIIRNSSERLLRTIHNVLDMSQLEAMSFNLRPESIDLSELAEMVVAEHASQAEEKNLDLIYRSHVKRPTIKADKYCISQALSNLLDNAIKYTQKGCITVSLSEEDRQIILQVKDTGIGITKKYQENLFDMFSQESSGYTKEFQGVGLGLALTKRYLDLNEIPITITSKKYVGTTFTLTFPIIKKSKVVSKKEKAEIPSVEPPDVGAVQGCLLVV